MNYTKINITLALVISCGLTVFAQTPQFNIIKPSTTGVPGEEVRVMKFDPAGNLWIAGRFYFWGEVGLAMLSADQLDHHPLPGGGFDTGAWRVWSSVHHPIPSPYIYDMEFGADGVTWIASDGLHSLRFGKIQRINAVKVQSICHSLQSPKGNAAVTSDR